MKIIAAIVLLAANPAFADPQLQSWFTARSASPAHIYRTDADKRSGQAVTTWSNGRNIQARPAFSGVQGIYFSTNWIYIRSTGLGSHVMGPWLNGNFPNLPTDQNFIFAIPRHPVVAKDDRFQRLGEIGMFVDGVRMFDSGDAFSFSTHAGRDADPRSGIGQGDRVWNRDALANEGPTLDASLGHQQNWGRYHYHAQPLALRYLIGDHVDFDTATKSYRESTSVPQKHSPILGWMHDGYPLYGPYGYSDPTNAASGVRRMRSGFALRNGEHGTDDLRRTGRKALPAWNGLNGNRTPQVLADSQFGPDVTDRYPLGHYLEDYAYLGDCGGVLGRDFDLNDRNARWCVTPEFPQGTFAYFTTIDAAGNSIYPYNMGRRYQGNPRGQLVRRIGEPVVTNFVNQANAAVATTADPKTATLTWSANGYVKTEK